MPMRIGVGVTVWDTSTFFSSLCKSISLKERAMGQVRSAPLPRPAEWPGSESDTTPLRCPGPLGPLQLGGALSVMPTAELLVVGTRTAHQPRPQAAGYQEARGENGTFRPDPTRPDLNLNLTTWHAFQEEDTSMSEHTGSRPLGPYIHPNSTAPAPGGTHATAAAATAAAAAAAAADKPRLGNAAVAA